jgi:hypothetical protein
MCVSRLLARNQVPSQSSSERNSDLPLSAVVIGAHAQGQDEHKNISVLTIGVAHEKNNVPYNIPTKRKKKRAETASNPSFSFITTASVELGCINETCCSSMVSCSSSPLSSPCDIDSGSDERAATC